MHSPEPWSAIEFEPGVTDRCQLLSAHGIEILEYPGVNAEDAARTIAAVNFCKDIPTEVLLQRDQGRRPICLREGRDITSKEYVYVPLANSAGKPPTDENYDGAVPPT